MPEESKTESETKTVEASVDLAAKVKSLEDQLAAIKAAPATNSGAATTVLKVTKRGFANDEMESFAHYLKTGDNIAYERAMKAANQGQTDSEGGYAVPDDFYNQVVQKRDEVSVMRQIGKAFVPTTLDRILVPTESTAATKLIRTAEEGTYDADNPVLGQLVVTIHKFTKELKMSEELEMDSPAFMRYISGLWGRAYGLAENYGFFNVASTGSNSIQSVTYAATSGTACASQTATTAAELVALIYAIGSAYSDNLVLVMRRATLGALRGLQGNPFNFIPNDNFSIGTGGANTSRSAGLIHGVPVYCTDDLPAQAAAVRHIVIFNPDFYFCAERQGLNVTRNPYLYEASGQVSYFARARFGGGLAQATAAYYMPSKT